MGENGEKLEKVGNGWNNWGKVGKMAKSGEKRPFWIPIFAKIDRDLPLQYVSSYIKYEVDRCIFD